MFNRLFSKNSSFIFLATTLFVSVFSNFSRANDEDLSREVANCKRFGGVVEAYESGGEEVFLCKFGTAGIGIATLYKYVMNSEKVAKMPGADIDLVAAVDAFVNFVEPIEEEEYAVLPAQKGDPNATASGLTIGVAHPRYGGEAAFRFTPGPNFKATKYCHQREGKSIPTVRASYKKILKACIFDSDFSAIDADTLLKGPQHPDNHQLVQVLVSIKLMLQ